MDDHATGGALSGARVQVWSEVFRDIVATFRKAPSPVPLDAVDHVDLITPPALTAVAVMFGWTNRVLRSGELILLAEEAGYLSEASPLVRSMFEHAMALHWVGDQGGAAVEALYRARRREITRLQSAQVAGWQFPDDVRELLDEFLSIGTDGGENDRLLHIKHRAKRYGLGHMYQAWLVEVWASHPTLASAKPYYRVDGSTFELFDVPDENRTTLVGQCLTAALLAVEAYNELLANSYFKPHLERWNALLS